MSIIQLHSGVLFNLASPDPLLIHLSDIAFALARINRFTGHANPPVSVAEHSINVSRICDPKDARHGLMHDAAEAFVGDVASPLKSMLPDYQRIERRVRHAIADRFGLLNDVNALGFDVWADPPSVKLADRRMLRWEATHTMRIDQARIAWERSWGDAEPLNVNECGSMVPLWMTPPELTAAFMREAERLGVRER